MPQTEAPRDLLVISYPGAMADSQMKKIAEAVKEAAGSTVRVLVLDQGGSATLLTRPPTLPGD
ncbi:hypothetical protein [Enterovirga aerilata]|uniref:Uncharacterized protein n=1 Tax=Enterovirga aerilata TaxID=2730920 RepID=A0A849I5B5_9HYPH|nr:hypothetical protein [Enterovirga sp. DB1703]NNM75046.1 hypothetical protein [Enterovirga sp. DB1703]